MQLSDIKKAVKLRKIADQMQKGIDAKQRPYEPGKTARQASQAAGMQSQADELSAQQKILRTLATDAEQGTVPEFMQGVKTRRLVEDILRQPTNEKAWAAAVFQDNIRECLDAIQKDRPRVSDIDIGTLYEKLGKYAKLDGFARISDIQELDAINKLAVLASKTEAEWAAKSLKGVVRKWRAYHKAGLTDLDILYKAKEWCEGIVRPSAADLQKRRIEEEDRALIGVKIEGFWPTPKHLAEQMVQEADIRPGMSVLEPSAGKGDIAMAIREEVPGANLVTCEIVPRLIRILEGRGFAVVEPDFMRLEEVQFDRILMNPPFEKRKDAAHVMHAFDLLRPGGKMVAIMGEGVFFGSDKKAVEFRAWLQDTARAVGEKLPQGTFKTNARIVHIKKYFDPELPKRRDKTIESARERVAPQRRLALEEKILGKLREEGVLLSVYTTDLERALGGTVRRTQLIWIAREMRDRLTQATMVRTLVNEYRPQTVTPPGDTLREFLEDRGMSQAELAQRTGYPAKVISEIINGKAAIPPAMALVLERTLGIPAHFWNRREAHYREAGPTVNERGASSISGIFWMGAILLIAILAVVFCLGGAIKVNLAGIG